MRKTLIFIFLFGLMSCVCKYQEQEIVDISTPSVCPDSEAGLWYRIIDGDTTAYLKLRAMYFDSNSLNKLLIYALIMSNKYQYSKAYIDVFYSICYSLAYVDGVDDTWNLDSFDETTRSMALDYLGKAAQEGDRQASGILGKYYIEGKYFKKDTILGRKLMGERPESLKLKKRSILYPVIQ